MADIINLRMARKAKLRVEKEISATENRAKFGQTKAAKLHDSANTGLDAKRLDRHLLNSSNEKL